MRRSVFGILLIFVTFQVLSQEKYGKDYGLTPPFDFDLKLSGTFGEVRSNHFHSGIDIKTQGVTGKPVRAVADGYISRIKISPSGFGRTLYVSHPNGLMSVYGHLQEFRSDVEKYTIGKQYQKESFYINLFPGKDRFPVKQGEIIALSGNSGYSMGPHLHFEIREDNTQVPNNPMHYGIVAKDDIKPVIKFLRVYPHGKDGLVNGLRFPYEVDLREEKKDVRIKDTIYVYGEFYFGINAIDRLNGSNNKSGFYSLSVYIDSVLEYHHAMDYFSFNTTRYVNSLIDYSEYVKSDRSFVRTAVDPNNRLKIYRSLSNDGVFTFKANEVRDVAIEIADIAGNTNTVYLSLQNIPADEVKVDTNVCYQGIKASWRNDNILSFEDMELYIPPYALYRNEFVKIDSSEALYGCFSPVYHIGEPGIPVHKFMELKIRPDSIPASGSEKFLIALMNEDHKPVSAGGTFRDGYVTTRVREFGSYSVMMDTVPPEIQPLNVSDTSFVNTQEAIRIEVSDAFSGLRDYRAEMNGKWILMEYDMKNDLMIYMIDSLTRKGGNDLRIEVSDNVGNISVFNAYLIH